MYHKKYRSLFRENNIISITKTNEIKRESNEKMEQLLTI